MKIIEKKQDLFKEKKQKNDVLVHCVSEDFEMGAGIAKEFKKRFPFFEIQKELIINQYSINKNGIFIVKIDNFFIVNLVTKEKYWQKPTYKTLEFSLLNLKKEFKAKKIPVNRLLMPKIGCGLDRLNWIKVKELLTKIFEDTNYEIIVCSI